MRIKKITQTPLPTGEAQVLDGYSTSTTDAYSCNYINTKANKFSTAEQRIGTWINGKPLYRKVLNITSIEATSGNATRYYTIDTNANNFNIINLYGNGINNTDGNLLPLGYVNYSRTSNIVYRIENHQFAIQTPYNLNNVNVFIEYTKTTD